MPLDALATGTVRETNTRAHTMGKKDGVGVQPGSKEGIQDTMGEDGVYMRSQRLLASALSSLMESSTDAYESLGAIMMMIVIMNNTWHRA